MPLSVKIVTPERTVFEADDVSYAVAPGVAGDVGILPGHGALATGLKVGEVALERAEGDEAFAISGGLLEVHNDHVQILAQTAEHRDKIDVDRAKVAHKRAKERLADKTSEIDMARAEAAVARAVNRIRIAGDEE